MDFAGKVWRLLVGIKDGLVLCLLLLFFGLLYAAMSSRAPVAQVTQGALRVQLVGTGVEESTEIDPWQVLSGGASPEGSFGCVMSPGACGLPLAMRGSRRWWLICRGFPVRAWSICKRLARRWMRYGQPKSRCWSMG